MGDRTGSLLLLPLAVLLAIVVPSAMSAGRQPAERATKTETAAAADAPPPVARTTARTAEALIREYYEATGPSQASAKAPASGRVEMHVTVGSPDKSIDLNLSAHESATPPPPAPPVKWDPLPQCFIASLPDPIDASNISYMFDRYLEALQRAMEVGGYTLDRFDLPWLDGDSDRYHLEPGRLLFRGSPRGEDPIRPLALVFVVGETPTGGIHKAAFVKAVDELKGSCDTSKAPVVEDGPVNRGPITHVSVLGPSFSGSEASLRTLIDYYNGSVAFTIVSGSATAVKRQALERNDNKTVFRTTVAADADARDQFFALVRRNEQKRARVLGWPFLRTPAPTQVALLYEGNTSFGQKASAEPLAATPTNGASQNLAVLEIPFPLHISGLRAAARQDDKKGTDPLDFVGQRRSLTRLEMKEAGAQRTVVPLQSKLETSSMELVLSALLETLDEQDLRYIGVVATDVQDLIFLSQQIRHHLPNSMLFLFSIDLLYLHPDVNADLRGAQVVSPYPLFTSNVAWTSLESPLGPQTAASHIVSRQLLFPSHTTQGMYNATLVLIGQRDWLQEYGHPRQAAAPPPLWLSIVGKEQIWPVRFLGATKTDPLVTARARPDNVWRLQTSGHPWLALFAIALGWIPALFLVSNAAGHWTPAFLKKRFEKGLLAELFSESIFPSQRVQRRAYLLRCWSSVATPYILCTFILLLPWSVAGVDPSIEWKRSLGMKVFELTLALGLLWVLIALIALTKTACGYEQRPLGEIRPDSAPTLAQTPDAGRLSPAIVWALVPIVVAISTAAVWYVQRGSEAAVFLYLRATELDSGVSPIVPLLLFSAAALAWSVTSLRRLRLLEGPSQYPVAVNTGARAQTFLGFTGASFNGIECLERELIEGIGQKSWVLNPYALAAISGVIVVAVVEFFVRRGVPTVEGASFDVLFAGSFFIVNLAAGLTVVRLVQVWRRLSRLLRRLAWHPTIKAYSRLAKSIPGKPKINLTGQSQIFTALEFSVDRAAEMVAKARELTLRPAVPASRGFRWQHLFTRRRADTPASVWFTDDVKQRVEDLASEVLYSQQALHDSLDAAASGRWAEKVAYRTCAEQHLSSISAKVTTMLKQAWTLPADYWIRTAAEKPDEVEMLTVAEDFLTSRVAGLLSHVVPQLQNLVVCLMSVLLLLLTAVTAYPFQPRQLLLMFVTVEIIAAVSVTMFVFVQMERDTILSALSETTPGQISWSRDFISRILVYIVLPLVGVLGAQFPEVVQQLLTGTGSAFAPH